MTGEGKECRGGPWDGFRSTAWIVSLGVHVALAGVVLVVSRCNPTGAVQHKRPAVSMIEARPEPLVHEVTVDDLRIDPLVPAAAPMQRVELPELTEPARSGAGPESIGVARVGGYAAGSSGLTVSAVGEYTTSFCGAVGSAKRICYVVDCSGSMILAFDYVRSQLKRTIGKLSPGQYFHVVFYASGEPLELPGKRLLRAHKRNRQDAMLFINQMNLASVPTARAAWQGVVNALGAAFAARTPAGRSVELIYLFTDGEFEHQRLAWAVRELQGEREKPAVISVVACGNRDNEEFLSWLARANGGEYHFVSDEQLAQVQGLN